jgi:NosL.
MKPGLSVVLGLVVGIVVGALLGGIALGTPGTVITETVRLVETATVTVPSGAELSPLEEALRNGTYWNRCIFCGMLINETRYSALVVLKSGYAVRTDDIGCIFRLTLLPPERWMEMRKYSADEVKRLVQVEKIFVPDHNTGEYVEAEKAFYVIRQDRKTPMGDCVFAFKEREKAAEVNATVYTYDQMLQLYKKVMEERGMPRPNWCKGVPGDMHKHEHHGHGGHGH